MVKCVISQSTGGSTGEDEEELSGTCLETKHNTHHNEFLDHELIEVSAVNSIFYFLCRMFRQMRTLEKIHIRRPKLVYAVHFFIVILKVERGKFKFYILYPLLCVYPYIIMKTYNAVRINLLLEQKLELIHFVYRQSQKI